MESLVKKMENLEDLEITQEVLDKFYCINRGTHFSLSMNCPICGRDTRIGGFREPSEALGMKINVIKMCKINNLHTAEEWNKHLNHSVFYYILEHMDKLI